MNDDQDFEEDEVYDIDENENAEIDAILHMDFEKALQISRRQFEINDETYDEECHYEEQSQILTQQVFDNYYSEVSQISKEYLENADHYQTLWQDYCKNLVVKQREEASILEQKWREARALELSRQTEKAQTEFATARLLAMCKLYDNAIGVRDKVQNYLEQKKSPELKKLDRDFAAQYKKMTNRHFSEFQFLHRHLKSLLKTLRLKAEGMKKTAEANLEVEKARNTTMIIQAVAKDKVSQAARDKIIQNFSPRKTRAESRAMSQASPRRDDSRLSAAVSYSGNRSLIRH
ncbi:hypothetical protein TRFO_22809 [Tritrichomonas foetus]|uniref:Uncharacterized protein n=1 Tax=Tritrichomonas foetus TaxID=1144522 RepID=A0A1J4KG47_9EUKA|nr:hypothetical protein TRFO_22809 [Tritrichomonas foetus]|eukprot:OHT08622.1 hypothetical protein TRFO_22809 [Tritrichomonas foetus]